MVLGGRVSRCRVWRSSLILSFVSCYLMWGMYIFSLSITSCLVLVSGLADAGLLLGLVDMRFR